jgi:hypothetical protein
MSLPGSAIGRYEEGPGEETRDLSLPRLAHNADHQSSDDRAALGVGRPRHPHILIQPTLQSGEGELAPQGILRCWVARTPLFERRGPPLG